ncbi:MAG: hypothetical protein ACRC57_07295 [Sarcina sp.]
MMEFKDLMNITNCFFIIINILCMVCIVIKHLKISNKGLEEYKKAIEILTNVVNEGTKVSNEINSNDKISKDLNVVDNAVDSLDKINDKFCDLNVKNNLANG